MQYLLDLPHLLILALVSFKSQLLSQLIGKQNERNRQSYLKSNPCREGTDEKGSTSAHLPCKCYARKTFSKVVANVSSNNDT